VLSWPDGGADAVRGEKDTNWEGGWRVPCVDCAGQESSSPGRVINDICSLQDFIPTFAAPMGETRLVEKVKKGLQSATRLQGALDGFNLLPFLAGKEEKSPRDGFLYWSDDGE
jgi:arylsulfatase